MKKILVLTLVVVLALSGLVLAADNKGFINQDGENNEGEIIQLDQYNYANISQEGTNNNTMIFQQPSPSQTEGHWAEVTQNGDSNQAEVDQIRGQTQHTTTVAQRGNDNFTSISQNGWYGGSTAEVTQIGNSNRAVHQFDNEDGSGLYSEGVINQLGDNNLASQVVEFKTRRNIKMSIEQIGNNNTATQHIGIHDPGWGIRSAFVDLKIKQDGYSNTATQTTLSAYGRELGSEYTTATISQYGNFNEAHGTQAGQLNANSIIQIGNNNYAKIDQSGISNNATINQ